MRAYETMVILHPELVSETLEAAIEKLKGILEQQEAEILKADNWGVRKLAYPVKKQGRGTYVLFVFKAASTVIAEFERRMRIDEMVLKYQTVVLDSEPVIEVAVETEPEAEAEATESASEETEAATDAEEQA